MKGMPGHYSSWFLLLVIINACSSCHDRQGRSTDMPRAGIWRGVIRLQGQELPFNFRLEHQDGEVGMELINRSERLMLDGISITKDSIWIPMHIFDTSIKARYTGATMTGIWRKHYLDDYALPFNATYGDEYRFSEVPEPAQADISGRWEVYFLDGNDSSLAVGEFVQQGTRLEGTFLRTTGDYRFLEGELDGDSLKLSTFEGEHAYLFKAALMDDDRISGTYWSGKTWNQPWIARRNRSVKLPDPDSLTFLKPGYERIDLVLPDLQGRPVSLDDPAYRDQVIILQVFGTWCSNCMDETRFLSDWYNRNRDRDVEIIAVAFERKDDLAYARDRITRMKERFDINYQFLFGGRSDKAVAAEIFSMLNTIVSFPTMIILDRNRKVKKIHTGFSGPGTGKHYDQFVEEFNRFMEQLLRE